MAAMRGQLETALVTASWFVLNISMGSSTKWLFIHGQICREGENGGGCRAYKFPLTITMVHMVFSWVMCRVHIYHLRSKSLRVTLTLAQQVNKVAPLACCFALSVAMGNLSLKYIYPSFNQMLGSMSPLITVAMALVFQRKRYNAWTWVSMPIICGGLVVCSAREVNFDAFGALFATGATLLRSAKSIIQGRLLSPNERLDSVTLLYYMAPWSAAMLLCFVLWFEGTEPFELLLSGFRDSGARGGPYVLVLLVASGLNACFLNVANFLVTAYTSAVTLQVLGNVKNCLAIVISVTVFRNPLTFAQAIGMLTCLFGVWLYNRKGGTVKPASKE